MFHNIMNSILIILILIFILQMIVLFFNTESINSMRGGSSFLYEPSSCKKLAYNLF